MEDLIPDPTDPDCTEMGTGDNFCTMLPDYNNTAFPYDLVDKTRYGYPECTCDYLIQLDGDGVLACRMKLMIRKKRSDLTNRVIFHPAKQQIGLSVTWLGVQFYSVGGFVVRPRARMPPRREEEEA